MFSIPTYAVYGPPNVPFPQRELLIFLACGVIVCTLLLATFVVPLLAPARDKGEEELRRIDQDAATTMDIMREVIEMLAAQQTRENRAETRAVIRSYNDRLARIKANNGIESEMNVELRVQALMWEYERAMELMERGVVSGVVAYRYMGRLEQAMQLLQHGKGHGTLKRWNGRFRALWHRGVRAVLRELPATRSWPSRPRKCAGCRRPRAPMPWSIWKRPSLPARCPPRTRRRCSWSTSARWRRCTMRGPR